MAQNQSIKPTAEELPLLRKGLRKRKVPNVFHEMWQSWPGIGGVMFRHDGNDFQVEWVSVVDGRKTPSQFVSFNSLCMDPVMEGLRLDIGWLMNELVQAQGQQVLSNIGHPDAAWREAKPYFDMAENWRHWALVPAGHYLNN